MLLTYRGNAAICFPTKNRLFTCGCGIGNDSPSKADQLIIVEHTNENRGFSLSPNLDYLLAYPFTGKIAALADLL